MVVVIYFGKKVSMVKNSNMANAACLHWPMLNDADGWRRPNDSSTYFERRRENHTTEYCDITPTKRHYNAFYIYSNAYLTPWICLIGLVGNCLNLAVFSSRTLRTKTNFFLASMALADALFLVAMYPTTLDAYEYLQGSERFKRIYFATIIPLTGLSNWFSAASIWFAVAVTVERTVAVTFPFRARHFCTSRRLLLTTVSIVLLTFFLTSYCYYSRKVHVLPVCKHCNVYSYRLLPLSSTSESSAALVATIFMIVSSLLVVIAPVFLTIILNVILVRHLQKRGNNDLQQKPSYESRGLEWKRTSSDQVRQTERHVTIMVSVIIACFILCNSLSAVIAIWQVADTLSHVKKTMLNSIVSDISNILVQLGRTLNFILYCVSSSAFRKHMLMIIYLKKIQISKNLSSIWSSREKKPKTVENKVSQKRDILMEQSCSYGST